MALRQFAFITTDASGLVYSDTASLTDSAQFSQLTLTGSGGVALDVQSNRITNVADPTSAQDAATKNYVDSLAQGVTWKAAARVIATGALPANTYSAGAETLTATANGALTIDGVGVAVSDRILVAGEVTAKNNGIYVVTQAGDGTHPYILTRASDFNATADISEGDSVFIAEGTTNSDTGWILTTNDPITLDTTALSFTQFTGLGEVNVSTGLTKSGNTISVKQGDGIDLASNGSAVNVALTANAGLTFTGTSPNKTVGVLANAGQGINVGASGVGITLAATPGLQFNTGLQVKADATTGIQVTASGVGITLNATPGLQFSTGLMVKVNAAAALSITASGVGVVANTAQGINVSASGVGITLAATNPGLNLTSGLAISLQATSGLVLGATGLAANLDSGTGGTMKFSSNTIAVALDPNGSLYGNGTSGIAVKLVSSARLTTGASGLDVVGVPSLFQINGAAVSANVTAANLNTLTAGATSNADALHTHTNTILHLTVDAVGVSGAGVAVYYSANNVVSAADSSNPAKVGIIGLSKATVAANGSGDFVRDGPLTGVLTAATAGTAYYLGHSGTPVLASSLVSGDRIIRLGYAINATDLFVSLEDIGRK